MEPKSPSKTTLIFGGAIMIVLWSLYLIFLGPRHWDDRFQAGDPAFYDLGLEDLNGRPVSFAQYKGKPVMLHIWATWCEPCAREMPLIEKLSQTPQMHDVSFVCVSIDDSLEPVRKFVAEHHLKLTVLRSTSELPDLFRSDALPAMFYITADGRVMRRRFGALDWSDPARAKEIRQLLLTPAAGGKSEKTKTKAAEPG